MRTKKIIIGTIMLVAILMCSTNALGVTVTKQESFTGYSSAIPPDGVTRNYSWYILNNKDNSYTYGYTKGWGDTKCLRMGSGTGGENFSTTIQFNYTGYGFTTVGYFLNMTSIGKTNKLVVTLNEIRNAITFNTTANFTHFKAYVGGVMLAGPMRCGAAGAKGWIAVNYTLNWTTHRLQINIANATSGASKGADWYAFTTKAGWVFPGNYVYKKMIGLTFSGSTRVACDALIDNIRATFTYVPSWRLSNPVPGNGWALIRHPASQVTVTRINAINENVTIYLPNASGVFNYQNYTHANCGTSITATWHNTNATLYQHTYYWKVVIVSFGAYQNRTYRFTTWSRNLIQMLGFPN